MEPGFGERLRALRTARGETLETVSQATGLSIAMLSRIERGERAPSPAAAESLAGHFGLSPDEVIEEAIANQVRGRWGAARAERIGERMQQDVIGFRRMPIEMLGAPRSFEHDRDADTSRVAVSSLRSGQRFDDDAAAEALDAIELAAAAQRHAAKTLMRALPEIDATRREEAVRAFASLSEEADTVLERLADGRRDERTDEMTRRASEERS